MLVQAIRECVVDGVYRAKDEVFEYDGPENHHLGEPTEEGLMSAPVMANHPSAILDLHRRKGPPSAHPADFFERQAADQRASSRGGPATSPHLAPRGAPNAGQPVPGVVLPGTPEAAPGAVAEPAAAPEPATAGRRGRRE